MSSLESLWDDVLEKFDAKGDIIYPGITAAANIFCRFVLLKQVITPLPVGTSQKASLKPG